LAIHQAARTDAFDDLLAEVTTLLKMQGVELPALVRDVAFRNVVAVARAAVLQAHRQEIFEAGLRRHAGEPGFDRRPLFEGRDQTKSGLAGRTRAQHHPVVPGGPAVIGFGNGRAQRRQQLSRFGPFQGEFVARFRRVLQCHVVGDDEAVDVLVDLPARLGLGRDQQVIVRA